MMNTFAQLENKEIRLFFLLADHIDEEQSTKHNCELLRHFDIAVEDLFLVEDYEDAMILNRRQIRFFTHVPAIELRGWIPREARQKNEETTRKIAKIALRKRIAQRDLGDHRIQQLLEENLRELFPLFQEGLVRSILEGLTRKRRLFVFAGSQHLLPVAARYPNEVYKLQLLLQDIPHMIIGSGHNL